MAGTRHRWRKVLLVVVAIGGVALLASTGGSALTKSLSSFSHVRLRLVAFAILAEFASMAAFARVQRRLLRAGGTKVHLRSVLAVTYAGNAISVSLPLAGSEVAAAYTFRQLSRQGLDSAAVAWALAVSGIFSSLAFALLLTAGAIVSDNVAAALIGFGGAVLWLLPTVAILAALRLAKVRRGLNQVIARVIRLSGRLFKRPGPRAADGLERFLDRIGGMHLPRLQYVEVFLLSLWNWLADCLCLGLAIRATGTPIPWHGLLLAYGAGMTAGSIGLTPGGLGVIEATLTASLVAAGLTSHRAFGGVLMYRLISFWLIVAAGWAVVAVLARTSRPKSPTIAPA